MQDGHEVVIYAGHSGFAESPPSEIDGVPVELFAVRRLVPGTGFAGLVAPGLLARLLRTVASFDVVHVHLARDLVTLPAAELTRLRKVRYVAQPHGMIDESDKWLARLLDFLSIRRVLQSAFKVFWLTPVEERSLRNVMSSKADNLANIRNGVPPARQSLTSNEAKDVLFLSRLHSRKRPALFVEAAIDILSRQDTWGFALVGPDEGEGQKVKSMISESHFRGKIRWEGSLAPERTLERMLQSSIYVLPSVDEPFPMSVLEALSIGLPVVITDSCGLAPDVSRSGCGFVVDASLEGLVGAIEMLMEDPSLRQEMSRRGLDLVNREFSMKSVSRDLQRIYTSAAPM